MHIAHYHGRLWGGGGIRTYVRAVAVEQREMGHRVTFLHRPVPEGYWKPPMGPNVTVSGTEDLAMRCRELGVDVLHMHGPLPGVASLPVRVVFSVHGHAGFCFSGTRFLKRSRKPCRRECGVVACTAGHVLERCGSVRPGTLRKRVARLSLEREPLFSVDCITMSGYMRDELINNNVPSARVHHLQMPFCGLLGATRVIDESQPGRFLFVGRLSMEKGAEVAIEAMAHLPGETCLDVVGDGDQRSNMESLVGRLGLEERVQFHGWREPHAVAELMQTSVAVLLPSLWQEPVGLVSLEAMAKARPVIASRVGGIPEFVEHGKTGMIVPPGNARALAGAMQALHENRQLAATLGQAGRRRVERAASLQRHVDRLISVYEFNSLR